MNNNHQNIIERFKSYDKDINKIKDYLGMNNNENTEGNDTLLDQISKLFEMNSSPLYINNSSTFKETINIKDCIGKEIIVLNNDNKYITGISLNPLADSTWFQLSNEFKTKFKEILSDGYIEGVSETIYGSLIVDTKNYYTFEFKSYINFDIIINDIKFADISYLVDLSSSNLLMLNGYPQNDNARVKTSRISTRFNFPDDSRYTNINIVHTGDRMITIGGGVTNGTELYYSGIKYSPNINNIIINGFNSNYNLGLLNAKSIKLSNFRMQEPIISYKKEKDCSKSDRDIMDTLNEIKILFEKETVLFMMETIFYLSEYDSVYNDINSKMIQ